MLHFQYDSGGPFTYKQGDQHVLIGVTSSVLATTVEYLENGGKKCGVGGKFVRVSYYRKWINRIIGKASKGDGNAKEEDPKFCDDYEAFDDEP